MRYLTLLLPLFGSPALADWFAHAETRELTAQTENIDTLEIRSGHGFLVVEGNTDQDDIIVTADIRVPAASRTKADRVIEQHLSLSLSSDGSTARLVGDFDDVINLIGEEPRVSLTVTVPARLNIEIEDGTGYITLDGITGTVDIDDGPGSIEVRNVEGAVSIDDGSGWIEIERVQAAVTIKDRSGGISVSRVDDDVTVDDGSGFIRVSDIGGDLRIAGNAHGRVTATGVQGVIKDES